MILVSFFFSHRALSKNLSRNGIGLKVTKFGDTNRHFLFNIKRFRSSLEPTLKGRVGLTEKRIFNYAKQYITPHLITEEHENDNEKI